MTVADGALREGLIQDLLGRIYNHDMRSATVQSVADRYHTDKKHAVRIKHTLSVMLEQLSADYSWLAMKAACNFWIGQLICTKSY